MARAKKTTRVIKRTQKTTVPAVLLELGEGEADFLQAVMAKISGSETDSPRKYAGRIARALKHATGQDYTDTDAYKLMVNPRTSSLRFKDYQPRDNGANVAAAMNYLKANPPGYVAPHIWDEAYSYRRHA